MSTEHSRPRSLQLIVLPLLLVVLTTATAAATGETTYSDVDVSLATNQTGYVCSDGCAVLITLENGGPINGTVANMTLFNRFSQQPVDRVGISARFGAQRNFTYLGTYTRLRKKSLSGLRDSAFWNSSRDGDGPYRVQFRFNLSGDTAQFWDMTFRMGIDGSQDWYRNFSVRTELRRLTLFAPQDRASPPSREVSFRFVVDRPQVSRMPCAVRYSGETVARNASVLTGTTTELTAPLQPEDRPGSWQVWCDMDNDTVEAAGEYSATRSFTDTDAPDVAVDGVLEPHIRDDPGEIAVRLSDNFMGVASARFAIVQDGQNRTAIGLTGDSPLTRYGNTSLYNASFDTSDFSEGSHTVWIIATDDAGNSVTRQATVTVDLIVRRPGFYWNRDWGVNLSTAPVHTCAPSCTAVIVMKNQGRLSGRLTKLNVSHSFSSGADPETVVAFRPQGGSYQTVESGDVVGMQFRNRSVRRAGRPASYRFRVQIDDHRRWGQWNMTVSLGTRQDGKSRYQSFTVSSGIQDIDLLWPRNNTQPENRIVNFSIRYRSPLRDRLHCYIVFEGDEPADVFLRNDTAADMVEVELEPRRHPSRWRTWCDNDGDEQRERGELSQYHWFNDTAAPELDLTGPARGTTITQDPLQITATAADNFIGISRLNYRIVRRSNGSERVIEDGRLQRVEQDRYRAEVDVADLVDRNYTVTVTAQDRAGNIVTSRTFATLAVKQEGGGIGSGLMNWVQNLISGSEERQQQEDEELQAFSPEIINMLIFLVLMVAAGIVTYWLVSSNVDY